MAASQVIRYAENGISIISRLIKIGIHTDVEPRDVYNVELTILHLVSTLTYNKSKVNHRILIEL